MKKNLFPDYFFAIKKNWLQKKVFQKKLLRFIYRVVAKKFKMKYLYSINNVDKNKFLLKDKNINIPIDFLVVHFLPLDITNTFSR